MPLVPRPAVVYLRMSPQLRTTLREAADRAGCSLNAFAVQILATAAGDPARFRATEEQAAEPGLRDLERDALGYPLRPRDRSIHISARTSFMDATEARLGAREMVALVKRYDAEDPAHFVEWKRLRDAANSVQNRKDRPGAG